MKNTYTGHATTATSGIKMIADLRERIATMEPPSAPAPVLPVDKPYNVAERLTLLVHSAFALALETVNKILEGDPDDTTTDEEQCARLAYDLVGAALQSALKAELADT